jgi:RHS repeat-associated protein
LNRHRVTFKYDPLGRRVYKSSSAATSIYAYDGDNMVEETNSSGTAVARYEQTEEIDEPLGMLRSAATSYYESDGLGSITSLSNGSGSLAQTYTSDSFGKQTASSGSLVNPFQYTGRESDTETGLYYYRARYYDPSSGRFVGEDPLLFGGGDANFYNYVSGGATNYTDPSGLGRVCPIVWLCPDERRLQPPTYTRSNTLPPGATRFTAPGGLTFWIPPGVDWCEEYAAAQKNGLNPLAVNSAVGQGGTYDYRRDPIKRVVYSPLKDAANYSVGVYMKGAGYPRWVTVVIGEAYGITHSSNYDWKKSGSWGKLWRDGWDAANSGAYSKSNCNCKGSN